MKEYFVPRQDGIQQNELDEEVCARADGSTNYRQKGKTMRCFLSTMNLLYLKGVYRNQGIFHDAEYCIMIDRDEGHRLKKATLKLAWKHLFDNHGSQADGVGNKW